MTYDLWPIWVLGPPNSQFVIAAVLGQSGVEALGQYPEGSALHLTQHTRPMRPESSVQRAAW
eukprot:scaffold169770_cov43-Tisochrysis_lutea.AAC.1